MTAKSRAGVAKLLGDLAVRMQDQPDTELTLQAIVEGAVAIVPGTRWAGISLVTGRRVIPRVPSAPLVAKLDCLQTALDDGPCISALREYHTVLIDDTSAESRWPRFSEAAAGLGVDSVLSFQLFVESENLGSLNLYSDEAGVFDEDAIFLGQLVAQHASVALVG
ncbi:MAG: response regulator receiver protein, partial [Mycobacterium sp.]|nr:response regulator receiver protein [Mycobacterium sp.]